MGTKSNDNLSSMLREYAPYKIQEDAFSKDFYIWNKLEKNREWKDGAELQIPFELAENSDLSMGSLVAENDIGEGLYEKIKLTSQPQMFSSMIIEERDLKRYSDKKQSFLKILPGKLEKLTRRMRHAYSAVILRGGMLAKVTVAGNTAGEISVDKPQYFTVGQKVLLKDASSVEGYVVKIDMASRKLTIHNARSAGTALDLSATGTEITTAGAVYIPGAASENFTSFVDYLLPASAGGSDTLYGTLNKNQYPIACPQVVDGSGFTSSTIVDKLVDFYFDVKELGKVDVGEILVPYQVFKAFGKKVETSKRYTQGEKSAGVGWTSLNVIGPAGDMKVTALSDMRDDLCFMINFEDFEFAGHRFLDRLTSPDGLEYHQVRGTNGYRFICDHVLQGDLIAKKLSSSAAIHSIPTL